MSAIVISSLVLISSLLISHVLSQQPEPVSCPGTPQPLITGDIYRVEDDQFSASSSYSSRFLPHDARTTRDSWCSADLGPSAEHWVQVDFRANVIIHMLQIGGYDSFGPSNDYLTQFRVEFGSSSSQLMTIRNSFNEVINFTRPNTHGERDVPLPAPILTRVLRIVSIAHTGPVPCVTMEALGCIQPPEVMSTTVSPLTLTTMSSSTPTTSSPLTPTTSPHSSVSTQIILPTPTSTLLSVTMTTATTTQSPNFSVAFQRGLISGAVSGSIVLLLLFLLHIAVVITCLVVKHRAKKVRLAKVEYTEGGEVRVVNNEIYGEDILPNSPKDKEAAELNTYETIGSPATNTNALADTYESIGSPLVYSYAAVDASVKINLTEGSKSKMVDEENGLQTSREEEQKVEHRNSLVDNPVYAGSQPATEENVARLIYNPIYGATS